MLNGRVISSTYEWFGMWHVPIVPLFYATMINAEFKDWKIDGIDDRVDVIFFLHRNVDEEVRLMKKLKNAQVVLLSKQMAHIPKIDIVIDYTKVSKYKDVYIPTWVAGWGCENVCRMCPVGRVCRGKYVERNIEYIFKEIDESAKVFDKRYGEWYDNNFFRQTRWKEIADKLNEYEYLWGALTEVAYIDIADLEYAYEKGLRFLYVGVESYNKKDLRWIGKKYVNRENWESWLDEVNEIGIRVIEFWMYGMPYQSIDEVKQIMKKRKWSIWQRLRMESYDNSSWKVLDKVANEKNKRVVRKWKKEIERMM